MFLRLVLVRVHLLSFTLQSFVDGPYPIPHVSLSVESGIQPLHLNSAMSMQYFNENCVAVIILITFNCKKYCNYLVHMS